MWNQPELKLAKWPFFLGDALLAGAAYFIYFQSKLPMGAWQIGFIVFCVAGGACLAIMPFLLEYRMFLKILESKTLTTVTAELKNLEGLAGQISSATNLWQTAQEQAQKTAGLAGELTDRMSREARGFTEFLQKSNDGEKATLKLEVEKLRRAEAEWVQIVVRMLDHVFALHQGALRSGQPNLIGQLGNFQNACRDAARRVGLAPFTAEPGEAFDAQRHQLIDGDPQRAAGAKVEETVATGYTFQGKILRPALVRLHGESGGSAAAEPSPVPAEIKQRQLPLATASVGPG